MQKGILKLFSLFLLFFAPILIIWLFLKHYYNFFITSSMIHLSSYFYDLTITKTGVENHQLLFTLQNTIPLKDIHGTSHDFAIDTSIDMEAVTFNVPMTLALLLAILWSMKVKRRWEILSSGLALLLALHLLSMLLFSLCTIAQTASLNPYIHYYLSRHYLAGEILCTIKDFLINYAARFEPFLIALFAWIKSLNELVEDRRPSTPKSPV